MEWASSDGLVIGGVLYEADGITWRAPLLVSAHGVPASSVKNVRSEVARFRHLLRAGYRVFRPAFRGSLGFGSYGGYMTLRALAMTDRLQAGVALYGFIDNRRMTLETGDFTYETEYLEPLSWSITERVRKSDVFPHLGSITSPLLLLHGDRDPICPLSESNVTCRALEALGVPVGLVVYPGEGHGFRKKKNRRDRARRMLAWFLTHLSP
jgi:dipeptidyl aminopeptidase/acylaminoacyl peptidase